MKILQECSNGTLKRIKPDSAAQMRCRIYTYCDSCRVGDRLLLFNLVTNEVLCLDHSDFTKGRVSLLSDSSELNPACRKYLLSHRFLVNETNEDWRDVEKIRYIMKLRDQVKFEGFHNFTILTTTDCNARCYYCFEKGTRKITMDEKTAVDTADFILRNCSKTGEKEVHIAWFGGEPLYNDKVIDIISRKLTDAGISISSSMVTNGLLLGDGMCKRAVDLWKLKRVQITLDGTEEIYNKTKAYIGGVTNAFATVISNIQSALDAGIDVSIRLNVSEYNIDDLYLLAQQLAERFPDKKPLVYGYILLQYNEEKYSHRRKKLEEKLKKLNDDLKTLGLFCGSGPLDTELLDGNEAAAKGSIRVYHCKADHPCSVVILPDGRLHSCEHIDDAHVWGSIYTDEDKFTARFQDPGSDRRVTPAEYWSERLVPDQCHSCRLYPFCVKLLHCPDQVENCDPALKERILLKVERAEKHFIREVEKLEL